MSRLLFLSLTALLGLTFILFETDALPSHLIAPDETLRYALNLLCILLAVGGAWCLMAWWRITPFRRLQNDVERADGQPHPDALRTYERCSSLRIILWFLLCLACTVIYYEASFVDNARYAVLILLIAGIFCWK